MGIEYEKTICKRNINGQKNHESHVHPKMLLKNTGTPLFFKDFIFLSNLYTQCGAQT